MFLTQGRVQRFSLFYFLIASFFLSLGLCQTSLAVDFNAFILKATQAIPGGGGYSTGTTAFHNLASSIAVNGKALATHPSKARPSFCSGATYLAFLTALTAMNLQGELDLSSAVWDSYLVQGQADGVGAWGRWNANGPGTARFFHETGIGVNFSDYSKARAGDFMKIFWNSSIGKSESGHSVIFLGTLTKNGVPYVRIWSSNQSTSGYGVRDVARSLIIRAVFSHVTNPSALGNILKIPSKDDYLASMLKRNSSVVEMNDMVGME